MMQQNGQTQDSIERRLEETLVSGGVRPLRRQRIPPADRPKLVLLKPGSKVPALESRGAGALRERSQRKTGGAALKDRRRAQVIVMPSPHAGKSKGAVFLAAAVTPFHLLRDAVGRWLMQLECLRRRG